MVHLESDHTASEATAITLWGSTASIARSLEIAAMASYADQIVAILPASVSIPNHLRAVEQVKGNLKYSRPLLCCVDSS